MAFDFSSLNHKGSLFTIDTEGMEGKKSAEIFKEIGSAPLLMRAVFVNRDTGYGESVSVVTNNGIIYFSKASLDVAHQIRDTEEAVKQLNNGGACFRIVEFESKKFKKKGYSFEFLPDEEIPDFIKDLISSGECDEKHKDEPVFKY